MSWSIPSGHGWNPGISMTPDMNMGTYTPEQWAYMQQQSWHQWTQWQQQFAQWQNQYGEKYAQQLRDMHNMTAVPPLPTGAVPPLPTGAVPPLPTGAVPPPVPPPDKPPPPPPHENDKPLYSRAQVQDTPSVAVTSQHSAQSGYSNGNTTTGNNQNWSYSADSNTEKQSTLGVNTEALRLLAEEEKLFHIQFKKWEEEIEKWKNENVNHPDRKAYNEYEQKFEACRAQLLERQQQMKRNRDDLLGSALSVSNTTNAGNHITSASPQLNNTVPQYTPNTLSNEKLNVLNQNNVQNYTNKNLPQYQYNNGTRPDCTSKDNKIVDPEDRCAISVGQQGYTDSKTISPKTQYSISIAQQIFGTNNNKKMTLQDRYDNNAIQQGYEGYGTKTDLQKRHDNTATQQDYRRNDNIDPLDRLDSYEIFNTEYRTAPPADSTFLPTSKSSKDIPGLDLVPDVKFSKQDVIDMTDDKISSHSLQPNPVAPDYSTISKGINNILGDEKIMNILSLVSNQMSTNNLSNQSKPYEPVDNLKTLNQWDANNSHCYKTDYGNQELNVPYRPQNISNYQNSQEQLQKYSRPVGQRYNDIYDNISNNKYVNVQQELHYERPNKFDNPNMTQRSVPPSTIRPNLLSPRSLLQNIPPQQNNPRYYHGGFEGKEIQQHKAIIQPTIRKWVDDPLFTPSIIVEYEHKALRLKAREFIEPVHMFDYNHKSKDGENNSTRDFEKEADELFTRKPRNSDVYTESWSSDRYTREYERRLPRDEFKERSKVGQLRDDHDIYVRRVEDRRYDEYNRFRRPEFDRRDRAVEMERTRDFSYVREKKITAEKEPNTNFSRDLERERDLGRERELRRDKEVLRDKDAQRDRDIGRNRDFGRDRDIVRERDYSRDRIPLRDPIRDRIMDRKDSSNRSRSRDGDSRKREHSRENDSSDSYGTKKVRDAKNSTSVASLTHVVMIDDLLEPPGREMRPEKIVIILRGPPGSGKSYLAKLIRDKEAEYGVTVRIMSIDDYFMQENEIEEKDATTGKMIRKPLLKYEYDEELEESYICSLKRAFRRSLTDGYFTFLIYDAINDQLRNYADIWNFARQYGFQVYISTMDLDPQACFRRNIHNRSLEDIEVITSRFFPTPAHHIQLDSTTLLQSASIREVQMEDVEDVTMEDAEVVEVDSSFTSKWEKMDDAAQLARLDGTSKPLRPSQLSMEDYLQLDEWQPNVAKPGKKTVRWADLEERREQEKIRAIGFVVGQTDWNRMTDPTMGSSALTQTKYIERVRRS